MVLPETLCNGLTDQLLDGDFACKKSSESLWINHTSADSQASSGFWLSLLQFVSQCWWVCHLLSQIHSCYASFWMHKCLQLIILFVLSSHPNSVELFFLIHLYNMFYRDIAIIWSRPFKEVGPVSCKLCNPPPLVIFFGANQKKGSQLLLYPWKSKHHLVGLRTIL